MMSITTESMVQFLKDDLAVDVDDINTETLLFSSGIVDSFALVSMMTFLESEAGIQISPADVNLSNFDSISRILAYVERAQA